jgi:hypothetical protein
MKTDENYYHTSIRSADYENYSITTNESCNTDNPVSTLTSIVFNPISSRNYFQKIKRKFRRPKIFNKKEKNKDPKKFTIIDIFHYCDEGNNNNLYKKLLKDDNKSTSSEETNIKTFQINDYLNKNYDDYLKSIKKSYFSYQYNHYSKKTNNLDLNEIKEETSKNYISNAENVFDELEPRYLVDERIFKLDEKLLDLSIPKLQIHIAKLIEQSEIIQIEFENIYDHCTLITNYVNNLMPILYKNIIIMSDKIQNMKNMKNSIKLNYLNVSSKLILRKQKQNNIKKVKNYLNIMKDMKNMIDKKDNNQIEKLYEINNLLPKLSFLKEMKNKIDLLLAGKNDYLIEELENMINNILDNLYIITEKDKDINGEYYKINNQLFTEIQKFRSKQDNNLFVKFNKVNIDKVKEKYFMSNLPQYSKNKLLNALIEINFDILKKNILKIQVLKTNKELLFIFNIVQMALAQIHLINNIFQNTEKENDNFCNEINNTILENINYFLLQNIKFIFQDIKSYVFNVTDLIIKHHIIKEIFKDYPSKKCFNISQLIEEYENKFIIEYSITKENKLREGINFDSFTKIDFIPYTYQIYINKICEFDILKVDSYDNTIQFFKMNMDNKKESEISKIKFPDNSQIKIMPTSLDLIIYSFETIKMLSSFSLNNYSKILNSFSTILKLFAQLNTEIIIESKGHITLITHNEISICFSNFKLIQELISTIYNNDKMKLLNQFSNGLFGKIYEEIIKIIEVDIFNLNKRLNQYIEEIIHGSIKEFEILVKKRNYPIVNNNNSEINNYCLNLIQNVNIIYKDIIDTFPKGFIDDMFRKNLEKFAKEIGIKFNILKIKKENEKKQVEKDLLYIIKNINNVIEIDLKTFKEMILLILQKFLPKEKKKK